MLREKIATAILILGNTLLVLFLLSVAYILIFDNHRPKSKAALSMATVRVLAGNLEHHRELNGSYPEMDIFLLQRRDEPFRDGWGVPIRYAISDSVIMIYSNGSNMADDLGLNDDIVVKIKRLQEY